ncbi:MAG TPA: hypothetical protein VMF32_05840 [Xanthobacteraceae bacterium]|nr:hypothetical protein [Xanthobacteraceae bacterium]
MKTWIENNGSVIWGWVALIVGSMLAAWLCRGTEFHRFTVGLLCASVSLLLAMGIFEIAWQSLISDGKTRCRERTVGDDEPTSAPRSNRPSKH